LSDLPSGQVLKQTDSFFTGAGVGSGTGLGAGAFWHLHAF